MTLGLGEPKVSHSNTAFCPSIKVYVLPSSVRICGGSSETQQEEEIRRNRTLPVSEAANRTGIFTNNIDVGVSEDGSVFIRGLTLVDSSVSKADIF